MERIAVFPGSFDPITRGHESIILRALPLFDRLIVAIGENSEKKSYFSLAQRINWIEKVFENVPEISVVSYQGLTVDFCRSVQARFILRGLRTSADFEFERSIGQINKNLNPDIETVFLLTTPEYTALNSSIVRDIIRNGGDASRFVPEAVNLSL
jgi:pantetheine-phosphate adenylyltransferase